MATTVYIQHVQQVIAAYRAAHMMVRSGSNIATADALSLPLNPS